MYKFMRFDIMYDLKNYLNKFQILPEDIIDISVSTSGNGYTNIGLLYFDRELDWEGE